MRLSPVVAILVGGLLVTILACGGESPAEPEPALAPVTSILLVTLDTTRADSIGPDAEGLSTPGFNRVAAEGRLFTRAYTTVPETLPAHTSIMTGLYPAGHTIHENARYVPASLPLLAELLAGRGYTTAAFVSGYPLSRQFGLARGFEHYDDDLGGTERRASATTDRAVAWLGRQHEGPVFVWVHYFDPHSPYEPPPGFDGDPYLGEIAAMDAHLARLLTAFEEHTSQPRAVAVAGDHGEGLGEHGESQHGNLLYDSTMRVPLAIAGPGVKAGRFDQPVSIRHLFHTILDWSGDSQEQSLANPVPEVVMGEAMKPFLNYGWQPQVMAVEENLKVIDDGRIVAFDLAGDPGEQYDVSMETDLSRSLRQALREYPIPTVGEAGGSGEISDEDRKQLESLGYIASDTRPVIRVDAPRPTEMTGLLDLLEKVSGLFSGGHYRESIPLLEKILVEDPYNLTSALRLAAAHSALGNNGAAIEAFERAREIAPESTDVDHYLALHHLRTGEWPRAEPLLERVMAKNPGRLPAVAAMAEVRMAQGRYQDVMTLLAKVAEHRSLTDAELAVSGRAAMELGRSDAAIESFEKLRASRGSAFEHDLELGVLYLDRRRLQEAKAALERVPRSHPGWPMALFKRAQVSVLLNEPDSRARIAAAREHADAVTGPLIEREQLFRVK